MKSRKVLLTGFLLFSIGLLSAKTEPVKSVSVFQKKPNDFEARFRVRLDSSQLPKPLQVNAFTNRDWALSSDWIALKPLVTLLEGSL
jgi:hypothetical protein